MVYPMWFKLAANGLGKVSSYPTVSYRSLSSNYSTVKVTEAAGPSSS